MKRRGFLGRLLAIPAAVKAVTHPQIEEVVRNLGGLIEQTFRRRQDHSLDAINQALKEAYPPSFFDDAVNHYGPFYRHLRKAAELEEERVALHTNAVIVGLEDPHEEPEG